jgi:hypothetical protein
LLKISWPRLIVTVSLASCLTLPLIWFVLPGWLPDRQQFAVVAEIWALSGETVWYALVNRLSLRSAFFLSFAANLASFLIGLVIY